MFLQIRVSAFKTSKFVCTFTFCINKIPTEMANRSNLLQLILTYITFNSRCQGHKIFKCVFEVQTDKTKTFQDVYSPNCPKPHYSKKPLLTRSSLNTTITAIYSTFLQAKCLQVHVI